MLRIWIGRYLCNELVEDRLPERVEVLGDHDEGPRAANHVVPVIIIEASRRIGVVGAEIRRILGQNDEAINGFAFGKSFVTRNSDVAAGIIVSIPRNVDRAACGVIWRAGELRYGEIDATTNRSPIREGTGASITWAEKSFAETSSWMMVQSTTIFCAPMPDHSTRLTPIRPRAPERMAWITRGLTMAAA